MMMQGVGFACSVTGCWLTSLVWREAAELSFKISRGWAKMARINTNCCAGVEGGLVYWQNLLENNRIGRINWQLKKLILFSSYDVVFIGFGYWENEMLRKQSLQIKTVQNSQSSQFNASLEPPSGFISASSPYLLLWWKIMTSSVH